jgi:lipoate-protein ligase A
MRAFWLETHEECMSSKDSQSATRIFVREFKKLSGVELAEAELEVATWAASSNGAKRYDARALIRVFRIRSAIDSLRERISSLENLEGAEALSEIKAIKELLHGLRPST